MRFAFATLLLPILALANPVPIATRDDKSIIAALDVVQQKLDILNTAVTSYTGGTVKGLSIAGKSSDVNKALQNADKAAKASKPLNTEQSGNVAGPLINLVNTSLDVIANLVAKKSVFQKAIFGRFSGAFIVKGQLQELKKTTNIFADDLTPKLTQDFQDVAPIILDPLNAAFDDAIKQFS